MRTFTGYRPNPPQEYREKEITNSGKSADYQGVIFDDGTVVIRWMTEYRSHSVWASYADFLTVHGHPEYGTEIYFDDGVTAPCQDLEGQTLTRERRGRIWKTPLKVPSLSRRLLACQLRACVRGLPAGAFRELEQGFPVLLCKESPVTRG